MQAQCAQSQWYGWCMRQAVFMRVVSARARGCVCANLVGSSLSYIFCSCQSSRKCRSLTGTPGGKPLYCGRKYSLQEERGIIQAPRGNHNWMLAALTHPIEQLLHKPHLHHLVLSVPVLQVGTPRTTHQMFKRGEM